MDNFDSLIIRRGNSEDRLPAGKTKSPALL